MIGTLVNALSIILGTAVGVFLHRGLPKKVNDILMTGLGLSVILIGLMSALETNQPILVIMSLCIGGAIGSILCLQDKIEALGLRIQNKINKRNEQNTFAEGLVTASLIYCVGAMAIMGSIESGLSGNHQVLYVKSLLDGIASIALSSTLGWGVGVSIIPVLLYQGSITLCAKYIAPLISEAMVTELSAVGGLIVVGIGLSLLNIKKIRTADFLPALVIPIIFYVIEGIL